MTNDKMDPYRTLKFSAVGGIWHGPYFFTALQLVDKRIGHSRTFQMAVKKALISHITIFPPFLAGLISFLAILDSRSVLNDLQLKFGMAIN